VAIPIAIRAKSGETQLDTVRTAQRRTPFVVEAGWLPETLIVDPNHRLFKWYRAEQLPVSLADAWRALGSGSPRVVFGPGVDPASRTRLFTFLRERFPRVEVGAEGAANGSVILVGEPAAQLRRQRAAHLDAPPPGTVQAFVARSERDPAHLIIAIEGDWPDAWPEIIPQAPLTVVRDRGSAIVSAMPPALRPISLTLPSLSP
jgi:hypothetical protein